VLLFFPFRLQVPLILLFLRKLVPAFRGDDAELLLAGLLVFGDELPLQKVGAKQKKGVGGARGPFLFHASPLFIAEACGLLGIQNEGFLSLMVGQRAIS